MYQIDRGDPIYDLKKKSAPCSSSSSSFRRLVVSSSRRRRRRRVGGMAEPLNPPHRFRCPGVSNQYALSTALNTCFNNLRGGPPGPPTPRGLNLVRPCWLHFSLLGASWAHSLSLAALVVALRRFLCVLGRSGLDFGGFRPGFGRVFGWFFGLKIHAKGNLKKIV